MKQLFERLVEMDEEAVNIVKEARDKADSMVKEAKVKSKDGLQDLKETTLNKEKKKKNEYEQEVESLKESFDEDFEKEFNTLKDRVEKNWNSAIESGVNLILEKNK